MNAKSVSIVVPIYKVEQYIYKCINSLLAQTLENIEIILVDDGSPDNCGKICNDFAKKYSDRIVVIHKKNGGLSDARNSGLKIAQGKYVLFVDSDDYIDSNSCYLLFNAAERANADIVVSNAVATFGNKSVYIKRSDYLKENEIYTADEFICTEISNGIFWRMSWLNLYDTKFLRQNSIWFVKGLLHEDEEWTPRTILLSKRIVYCNKAFYHYVIRKESITQSRNTKKNIRDIITIYKEKLNLYTDLKNSRTRKLLLDDTVKAILHSYCKLRMYDYPEYRNAFNEYNFLLYTCTLKTALKSLLFMFSKKMYNKAYFFRNSGDMF